MKYSAGIARAYISLFFLLQFAGCGGSDTSRGPTQLSVSLKNQPPVGVVGTSYPEVTAIASGGVPPYTWSETGTLPPCLSFVGGVGHPAVLNNSSSPVSGIAPQQVVTPS